MATGAYDAIVIGGGHNGLVHAAYLARAGQRVVVLERRAVLGGATLSEEAFPGFRYSVFSYLVSLLRPEVIHDLDLVRHGLFLVPLESTLNPLYGGDELYREACAERTFHNIARHSLRDAEAYPEFKVRMNQVARLAHRLQDTVPSDTLRRELAGVDAVGEESGVLAELARFFAGEPSEAVLDLVQMLTMSSEDFLAQWFDFDPLRAALSTSSIIGSFVSPRTPGSAYVLLHHYMGEIDGVYRGWAFQKGGTGGLVEVLARAARSLGVEIRTEAPVQQVRVVDGRTTGVVLENGDELEAPVVSSSASLQLSFLRLLESGLLPEEDLAWVRRWQSRGCSAKVNLALDRLPSFACRPEPGAHLAGGVSISPSVSEIEEAYDDAIDGHYSRRPFLDLVLPSVLDPEMAPEGQHSLSCFVQYAPYELAAGTWEQHRDGLGDAVVARLSEFIPGLEETILHRQVLAPPDIEAVAGIVGGNIFHGEIRLSQLFFNRPAPWVSAYATPIPGYYLCGSASHPGGGISGGPGRLAALRVLEDRRRAGA